MEKQFLGHFTANNEYIRKGWARKNLIKWCKQKSERLSFTWCKKLIINLKNVRNMLLLSMDTPPKFNVHKTLPRMSYKCTTYVSSIYLECLMGYFASEDYPSGIHLLKVTFYTWWKHQKTSWKHQKTTDAFWVHRNETLAWIRLKNKLNKYAFEYMKVSNISFSEEWQNLSKQDVLWTLQKMNILFVQSQLYFRLWNWIL